MFMRMKACCKCSNASKLPICLKVILCNGTLKFPDKLQLFFPPIKMEIRKRFFAYAGSSA